MEGTPYTADDLMYSINQELTAAREALATKGPYPSPDDDRYTIKWNECHGRSYTKWLDLTDDRNFCITEFCPHDILLLVRAKENFIPLMKELAQYRVTDDDLKCMTEALELLVGRE